MKTPGLLIFCLLIVLQANAQPPHPFPSQERVTALMDKAMKKSDLPAVVAIAINSNGERIDYTHGNAIWTEEGKVTPQHIFRIASMTKVITSIAALQLVELGLVKLNDDLSGLLPDMARIPILSNGKLVTPQRPITLHDLLTHTSGFGYEFTDIELANFDKTKWTYKDLPRRFETSTQFLYGSGTYWVGQLVEKISGMDLEKYFRKNITGPLGMNRTFFNLPDSLKPYVVSRGARGADGKQKLTETSPRIPKTVVTDFRGDGGLFSSPDDYTNLLKCLLNYGTLNNTVILKKETILEMSKNQIGDISMKLAGAFFDQGRCCDFRGITSPDTKWGLAWLIDPYDQEYGRRGGTVLWGGLYNTYFYIDYESGVAASIYTQHLPFNHPATTTMFNTFSEILYSGK